MLWAPLKINMIPTTAIRRGSIGICFAKHYATIPGVLQWLDDEDRLRLPSSPIPSPNDLLTSTKLKNAETLLHQKLEEFRSVMNYGRGIASPQVNEHYRLVALNLGGDPAKYQALNDNSQGFQGGTSKTSFSLFNPVITKHSNETFTMWDDCMSFPHLMVRVRRNTKVSIRFWTVVQQDDMQEGRVVLASDNEGNAVVEIEWCNVPQDISELLQHEIDHLDGVLSMDRIASDPSTDIIDRNEYLENSFKFDQMVEYTIAPTI